jgi:hypothetical protein
VHWQPVLFVLSSLPVSHTKRLNDIDGVCHALPGVTGRTLFFGKLGTELLSTSTVCRARAFQSNCRWTPIGTRWVLGGVPRVTYGSESPRVRPAAAWRPQMWGITSMATGLE